MAKIFQLVESNNMFEVVVPRNFAMVCFRVFPTTLEKELNGCNIESGNIKAKLIDQEYENDFNRNLFETVNESGKVFMTHTIVEGIYVIRFVVGATLTEDKHVISRLGKWRKI
ncbi:hypothetical protein Goarm_003908, partial [Gossypium armourianum]|nr:hypothetical protein [Gossypium armourianum]